MPVMPVMPKNRTKMCVVEEPQREKENESLS